MAINFPSSPTNGQTFISGTTVYTYSTATGAWSAAPLGTALPFNYFINPSAASSTEFGSNAQTATGSYQADQWWQEYSGTMVVSAKRHQTPVSPNGSANRFQFTITTADTSLTTTEHWQFIHRLEGVRMAPFGWGNATTAKPIVIRFWFKGAAGTYTINLSNPAFNYSFIGPFTITAGQANVDTPVIIPVPVPPAGTWALPTDTGIGMQFSVCLGFGPSYLGVAGWQTGGLYTVSGATNGLATTSAIFEFSDFGMYLDPLGTGKPPPWEVEPELTAFLDGARYWQKNKGGSGGVAATNGGNRMAWPLYVQMRASPTAVIGSSPVSCYDGVTSSITTSIGANYSNTLVMEITGATAVATFVVGRGCLNLRNNGAFMAIGARM